MYKHIEATLFAGKKKKSRKSEPSTYTLIKLSPLSSSDEAFAIWIPGHTGQTVFVGLGHFGAQLPRLDTKAIDRDGSKMGGGRDDTSRNIK